MSYITTVTGKHFYPMEPKDQDIDIYDIAHALSLICRANGHFRFFYSVAQHSLACAEEAVARGCSPEVILGCLLHDASEAYLCDVTRPVKRKLPQYLEAEDNLQNEIWKRFIGRKLTENELEQISEIDDHMLSMEFHQLMPEDLNIDYQKLVKEIVCEYQDPQEVKARFIQAATFDIEIERLLQEDYWLIDIFPLQIPESKAEEYFSAEQEYLKSDRLSTLYQKFADIMTFLNDSFDTVLYCLPEGSLQNCPDNAEIQSSVLNRTRNGCVYLLLRKERTLLTLNAPDLNMTVYNPTEEILSVLQQAVKSKELYMWQTPQIIRVKKYEIYLSEARSLLKTEARSNEENKSLKFLVGELENYYDSEQWKKDFTDDEAGLLPKKLSRGVLSEDGIYNLLEEYKEVTT